MELPAENAPSTEMWTSVREVGGRQIVLWPQSAENENDVRFFAITEAMPEGEAEKTFAGVQPQILHDAVTEGRLREISDPFPDAGDAMAAAANLSALLGEPGIEIVKIPNAVGCPLDVKVRCNACGQWTNGRLYFDSLMRLVDSDGGLAFSNGWTCIGCLGEPWSSVDSVVTFQ